MMKRRSLFPGLLAPAVFAAPAGRLPDLTRSPRDAKLTKEPFGDLLLYFDGPTEQLKSMTAGSLRLKAGMTPHAPHKHPEEEFMVVTEGEGEISVEGKITKVAAGSMMYCGANKLHGIVNTGKTPLLFYFYKWRK
jgi:mannose-6-phosphate isomerase-like protein (cupin superfamily)